MPYNHLSACEREIIVNRRAKGDSLSQIALLLGRDHSTIGRELKRNTQGGVYDACHAEGLAQSRRHRPRHFQRRFHAPLWEQVCQWLERDWSPEIIVEKLHEHYPYDQAMRISPEAVYQWVYRDARHGGTCELTQIKCNRKE